VCVDQEPTPQKDDFNYWFIKGFPLAHYTPVYGPLKWTDILTAFKPRYQIDSLLNRKFELFTLLCDTYAVKPVNMTVDHN
jgi:hypothetical protein